ncbi:MAG: Gfo/Idh/MocA family oxidoreductase [Acetatifactor sp.]
MIKIMQIGYGYWGNNVAKKLLMSPNCVFSYLVETCEEKRSAAQKSMPDVAVIDDYKKHLADVDAVVICTQTQYSFQIAMDAMDAGKHVFIEKPLAQNVALAEELIEKANENKLILHCDHLMVYNPVIRYIKNMIDREELGEIMYIDISRINLGIVRKDINAMLDLAVHDIAVVDFLLGRLEPQKLYATGTRFFGEQDTITYLSMKDKNTLININSSWISPVKVRRSVIAGTKKMVIFDDTKLDGKLRIFDSGIDVVQGKVYGEYEVKTRNGDVYMPHIPNEDALLNSIEHFIHCVMTGEESLSGPRQSLRVMKILERAQKELRK